MEKIKSIGRYFSSRGTEENFYTTGRAVVWYVRKILNQIGLRVTEGHMKTAVVRLAIMGINPGIKFLIRATH
jgi:hypothetical protein